MFRTDSLHVHCRVANSIFLFATVDTIDDDDGGDDNDCNN